jgi:single-strand DNA-binding protein
MVNKVILIGNVGADPEIRTLENGTKVARVRLATTERFRDRQTQENKEHTEWHTVTLWRNLADVTDRFVRKGSQIYVDGSLRSREWTDKEGVKRYGVEIVANELKLLGRRPEGGVAPIDGTSYGNQGGNTYSGGSGATSYGNAQNYSKPDAPAPAPTGPSDDIDDLPF